MNFKADPKLAHDLKQYCLDHGKEGKSLKIGEVICSAIREKLDKEGGENA